jgi:hypothetical protein
VTQATNCPRLEIIPSKEILTNLPLFINFVKQQSRTGGNASDTNIMNHLLSHKISSERLGSSNFYRAYQEVVAKLRLEIAEEYLKLPHYLRLFRRDNPTSSVALQVDDEGPFYRMFVS